MMASDGQHVWLGALGAQRFSRTRGALNVTPAAGIVVVAFFMLYNSLRA
jgi:hypothetical protein